MKVRAITDIEGVFAGATACGIKQGKKDLAFIFVPEAFSSAGVFTRNKFASPSCTHSRSCLEKGVLKGVIINSGNANAATGREGLKNARETSLVASGFLGLRPSEVATSSTGIIGVQLPMDKVRSGMKKLLASPYRKDGHDAARAIMTTDTYEKEVFLTRKIGRKEVTVAGIAKGSGMIAPNMGTMLGFLATDARIPSKTLQQMLREAVDDSFNMTSVDTDTSTNDMVLLFSTGNVEIDLRSATVKRAFQQQLLEACQKLAKMIAADGEGARKLLEVTVEGAVSKEEARQIALNVLNSPLVKTAVHGADPNWGRVIAAAGKDPSLHVDPEKLDLYFAKQQVMSRGHILPFDKKKLSRLLKQDEVKVLLQLHLGKHSATGWGCDLTKGYIDINVAYT